MLYDRKRVRENVRKAETEDLLDRVTVYRAGMEPDALYVIEEELRQRGVTAADIDAHARRREEAGLCDNDGIAAQLFVVLRGRPWCGAGGWHKLWGLLPLFPWPLLLLRRPPTRYFALTS